MDKIIINLNELLLCLSNAQDLVSPLLRNHHEQVGYLAFRLAEQLKLSNKQQKNIFIAAQIHDIGSFSTDERLELIETEPIGVNNHAFIGARIVEDFRPLRQLSNFIRYHHLPWNDGKGSMYMGNDVPLESHIIHLADRVCTKIDIHKNIISQIPFILSEIDKGRGTLFVPKVVDALIALSKTEYIWLDLISQSPVKKLPKGIYEVLALDIDDIVDISSMFSKIIDFRSRYTSRHSAGVAKTAQRLAELVGFSKYECKMMLVAGYLHDLGKLAIRNDVLEKPSKLDEDEFNEIRSHTYYTYQLLDSIPQFDTIKTWASYHHEKISGNGYPFHIKDNNLSLGARVMAVADVFTAITEDRPYRKGMSVEQAKEVLHSMVDSGALDKRVVDILCDNFDAINSLRKNEQKKAQKLYESFLSE
ncbi:MAG: Cyclic di-GMP phosphodiesterase response regulator RpfG [Firmicutes bacterium ADurb.Bin193]|nr:MAG: Cyclic di-GMP phosphodiesterase response regulator RpfG [Firmicutes bacterium ADurb.Bin193]